MKQTLLFIVLGLGLLRPAAGAERFESKPSDPYFEKFAPLAAPRPKAPVLQPGSRLAICGDSITEQRMYSRIMETYITVALPDLGVSIRQYGWSGEQASGFLARMTNDVLRFAPTVATTCYGMNDHRYRPYEEAIGLAYASNMTDIILGFKEAGANVVVGSPGCTGVKPPPWNWIAGTPEDRNLSLCMLRNIDVELAGINQVGFADVFWTMFQAQYQALQRWGTNYSLCGKDSVHPGWAGHLVMAYAFLKGLDVPGDIGTFTIDLKGRKTQVSAGHQLISQGNGSATIKSERYPFCANGPIDSDDSIRSGMALVPFNQELNRLTLLVLHTRPGGRYKVTWGATSRDYTGAQLKAGINLADDFTVNPFSAAFKAVDEAVAKKQEFETREIKLLMHGDPGKANMDQTVLDAERDRGPLALAVKTAFVPVVHTITITPLETK